MILLCKIGLIVFFQTLEDLASQSEYKYGPLDSSGLQTVLQVRERLTKVVHDPSFVLLFFCSKVLLQGLEKGCQ